MLTQMFYFHFRGFANTTYILLKKIKAKCTPKPTK